MQAMDYLATVLDHSPNISSLDLQFRDINTEISMQQRSEEELTPNLYAVLKLPLTTENVERESMLFGEG